MLYCIMGTSNSKSVLEDFLFKFNTERYTLIMLLHDCETYIGNLALTYLEAMRSGTEIFNSVLKWHTSVGN